MNELEVEIRAAEPKARTIFIEPDVYRASGGRPPRAMTRVAPAVCHASCGIVQTLRRELAASKGSS